MMRPLIRAFAFFVLAAWPTGSADAQALWCAPLGAYYPYVSTCPVPWQPAPGYAPGPSVPNYPPPLGAIPPPPPGPPPPPPPGPMTTAPPLAPPRGPETLSPADQQRAEERQAAQHSYAAEIGMQREQDAADGYRTVTVASAVAGFKKIANRIIVTGYYAASDRLPTLADNPDASERLILVADKLPRAGRSMLVDCTACRITIWARKGCSKAALGDQPNAACVIIERVKKGAYEADTPIFR
jgi:hypothetical protein